MLRNFNLRSLPSVMLRGGARLWLQTAVVVLGLLNAVALFLYLSPPGGSRHELEQESQSLSTSILAAQRQTVRLKSVSGKVQLGGQQAIDFQSRYILPERLAYESVIAEVQTMAQKAGITEREGQINKEPLEGSADLSVLTDTVNFEGSYTSLVKFLYEVDRSSRMLILDSLTASPEKPGQVRAQARFQALLREESTNGTGKQ
jgi:Tfp pilus assembly protein PilO